MDEQRNGTGDYDEVSTPRLQDRIAKASQDQERTLDALHAGAVRLKGAAIATNDEVQAQNFVLDQIAIQVDTTQQAVVTQTAVAKKVTAKHRALCAYYIIILLEIVALIVVLVI